VKRNTGVPSLGSRLGGLIDDPVAAGDSAGRLAFFDQRLEESCDLLFIDLFESFGGDRGDVGIDLP
jgi:hypothetical protein